MVQTTYAHSSHRILVYRLCFLCRVSSVTKKPSNINSLKEFSVNHLQGK